MPTEIFSVAFGSIAVRLDRASSGVTVLVQFQGYGKQYLALGGDMSRGFVEAYFVCKFIENVDI